MQLKEAGSDMLACAELEYQANIGVVVVRSSTVADRQTDGRQQMANVKLSSRSLKTRLSNWVLSCSTDNGGSDC